MSYLSDYYKQRHEANLNYFFGENNLKRTNNRFQIKEHVMDEDTILLVTNNVSYWSNKDQFVMWVADDKIIYLKSWQVMRVNNWEEIGDCYIVKLNRNYFKSYSCFKNDNLAFDGKEESFDDLLQIAKSQNQSELWFRQF